MSQVFSIPSDEINLYPLVNGHVPVLSVPSQEIVISSARAVKSKDDSFSG